MATKITQLTAIFSIMFLLLSMPFIIALIVPREFQMTPFSIYNEGWEGMSEFRKILEDEAGASITTIMGSTNAISRTNATEFSDEMGAMIIMGPTIPYDPTESLAIMMYLAKGGRVMICDDFGSGKDILNMISMIIANLPLEDMLPLNFDFQGATLDITNPIVGFGINGSLLVDMDSNDGGNKPVLPVFQPPAPGGYEDQEYTEAFPWNRELTENVDNGVVGNYASVVVMKVKYPGDFDGDGVLDWIDDDGDGYGPFSKEPNTDHNESYIYQTKWVPMSEFPADLVYELADFGISLDFKFKFYLSALYSSDKSWLEANVTAARDASNIHPDPSEWGAVQFPVFFALPLGGFDENGLMEPFPELIICSDPSIFINENLNNANYDNRQFAINVAKHLLANREGNVVYFDEGHLAHPPSSPSLYLGIYFRTLDMITMFPLIAPMIPIGVLFYANKVKPKGGAAKPLLMTKVEGYVGRSFFTVKMRWFLEYRHFTKGLYAIYGRTKRRVQHKYKFSEAITPETIAYYLKSEYKEIDERKLTRQLQSIEEVLRRRSILTEDQFMNHYHVLKDILDRVS